MSGRKPGCGRPRATRGARCVVSLVGGCAVACFGDWGRFGGLFWRLGSFCGLGEEMRVVMWTFSFNLLQELIRDDLFW